MGYLVCIIPVPDETNPGNILFTVKLVQELQKKGIVLQSDKYLNPCPQWEFMHVMITDEVMYHSES
jgi:hypothetical protein